MKTAGSRLSRLFDAIYSPRNHQMMEHWIVVIAVLAFLVHLGSVVLARRVANPPLFLSGAGRNLFSAIYTPFSIVLFYEVLVLIAAIPQSTTRGLATQYEIVSLIFIRGFFKDIASLDLENGSEAIREMVPALIDVSAGLLMFLLVALFRRAAGRDALRGQLTPALEKFIVWKKAVALVLLLLFLGLAASTLYRFEIEIFHPKYTIGKSRAPFYDDVFTAMIFTDVLILLLSVWVTDRYESVFRNAAFVISAILIRFSLTAEHPYGAALGVAGMVFGIVTVLIYNYSRRVNVQVTA